MCLREHQLNAFPQEMLTASEKECIIHRSYNISVGVSAAECLILFTLPFKIFPEDSSDG